MSTSEIRAIVDAHGWSGFRAMYPEEWKCIDRERKAADKLIDAMEAEECRRVGC